MKILIIEDEEILLKVLKDRFTEDGWDVSVADNGNDAIQKLQAEHFDIVLLDLIMPGTNGFDVLESINKSPVLKDLPVLVLSNLGDDDSIKRAMSLGAKGYFVKAQHQVLEIIQKAKKLATNK